MNSDLSTEEVMSLPDAEEAAGETDDRMTVEEMAGSLTGYEEIAIAKAFKIPDYTDLPATMLGRAMAFALFRRDEGVSDGDAYQRVMAMTLKDVREQFSGDLEVDPDHPETESGKGGSSRA